MVSRDDQCQAGDEFHRQLDEALSVVAPVAIADIIKGILPGGGAVLAAFATEPETSTPASLPCIVDSPTTFVAVDN